MCDDMGPGALHWICDWVVAHNIDQNNCLKNVILSTTVYFLVKVGDNAHLPWQFCSEGLCVYAHSHTYIHIEPIWTFHN